MCGFPIGTQRADFPYALHDSHRDRVEDAKEYDDDNNGFYERELRIKPVNRVAIVDAIQLVEREGFQLGKRFLGRCYERGPAAQA